MRTSTLIGALAVLLTANSANAIPGLSCDAQPRFDCEVATSAVFKLSRKFPFSGKDKLLWKWKGSGEVDDFGDPDLTGHYMLCVYDGLTLKAGFPVDPSSNWSATSTGFKYADKEGSEAGVTSIILSAKGGKAKVTLKGGGANLTLPYPGLDTQHPTVQLNNSDTPDCWTATGTLPPVKNTETVAVDKCGSNANPCTEPLPGCQAFVGGSCWRHGEFGESCDDVCAGVGKSCSPATITYAGSAGTQANCDSVLSALGLFPTAFSGACPPTLGLGCALNDVDTYHCSSPATTCGLGIPTARRICACE